MTQYSEALVTTFKREAKSKAATARFTDQSKTKCLTTRAVKKLPKFVYNSVLDTLSLISNTEVRKDGEC